MPAIQYIYFNLPYNRIIYITFYNQSQWRSQPKNLGCAKKFGGPKCMILANNTILFGKTPLQAQNNYIFQKFLGEWPLWPPPGYAYAQSKILLLTIMHCSLHKKQFRP